MILRHTKVVVTCTLAVLLTACSAQSAEKRTAQSSSASRGASHTVRQAAYTAGPAPVATLAAASSDASPAAGPATAETATPAAASALAGTPSAVSVTLAAAPGAPERAPANEPAYREVRVPAGTSLRIDLRTTVASDTSHVEDRVTAALRQPVVVRGVEVLPTGTRLVGHVTQAERSARVKGRARVGFRFSSLDLPGAGGRTPIRTSAVVRVAQATKKQDAMKIGGGAAGGAVIGAILGGGDGAAKGAALGGAGGTGVVLATRGKEVRVPAGTNLIVRLESPITLRVRR
jgi:hypothetical protein